MKHFSPKGTTALGSTVLYTIKLCEREISPEQVISSGSPEKNTNLLYFIIETFAFIGTRDHLTLLKFLHVSQASVFGLNVKLKYVAKILSVSSSGPR